MNRLPDKRHYSLDEMMNRLKDVQAAKEGRSRRRRTQQGMPGRQVVMVRIALVGLLLLVVVGGGLFAFGKFQEMRYASTGFRQDVSGRLSELLGLDVTLGSIEIDGRKLVMRDATAEGRGDNVVRDIRLEGVRGEFSLSSYFSPEWQVDPLEVFKATAVIDAPGRDRESGGGGGDSPELSTGGLGLSSEPSAVELGTVRLRDLDIYWGNAAAGDRLGGATVIVDVLADSLKLHGDGGVLERGRLPAFKLHSFSGEVQDGVLQLKRARLAVGEDDELTMEGTVGLRAGGGIDINGTVSRLGILSLLPDYWNTRLEGDVEAEFKLTNSYSSGESEMTGTFTIRDLIMHDMNFLNALGVLTGEHGLAFLEIPVVTGEFVSRDGELVVSGFDAARSGLIKIGGEIRIDRSDNLSGILELGIPVATFDKILSGRPSYFEVRADGLAWATLNLSGTLNSPGEDLTAKLQSDVRRRMERTAPPPQGPIVPPLQVPPPPTAVPPTPVPSVPQEGTAPGQPEDKGDGTNTLDEVFEELIRQE